MPKNEDDDIVLITTVHDHDDLKLTLEYPKNREKFSDLTQEEFVSQIEVFARILFDSLANKRRKNFKIILNQETGLYEYVIPTT